MDIRFFQQGFNYSQDGPGNRLVLHLQGCNLRCPWCSNPEGLCFDGGKTMSVASLLDLARSCRMMFFHGGGVTLTGGEASMQFDAVKEFLTALHQEGIHTALETNGINPRLPELFPVVDYLIMDYKHHDAEIHRKVTGASNDLTRRNIALALEAGKNPAVRIPLIGGFNASKEDAHQFAAVFQELGLPGHGTLELLCYHEYGKDKYAAHGMEYTMTTDARISPEILQYFERTLTDAGLTPIRT